jgi:hypothetical protein
LACILAHFFQRRAIPPASFFVPTLHAHDPLLHHMALVLQTAIAGEAGQLYGA